MEWWVFLLAFLGGLFLLLLLRVPIAFAMLGVGMVAAWFQFGGGAEAALRQLSLSAYNSVNSFVLTPIPLFILMGEVLFQAGVARDALNVLDRQLGRIPGRLAVMTTAGGTLFGLLSGSMLANTALFGSTILPEMTRAGYSRRLGMGSILASGGLAMIIPPSALAVLWGAIAQVPIGPLLIAGIIPGVMMAVGYVIIIFYWSIVLKGAPDTEVRRAYPLRQQVTDLLVYALPLGAVIFMVLGLIFFGIATPTESAATGALASILVVTAYGRLKWKPMKAALMRTVNTTVLIFMILVGSALYSQLMSFSGATSGFVNAMIGFPLGAIGVLVVIQLVVVLLGMFLDQASIMLVTLPLFMPVVNAQGWDPIWFGIIMLINLQIAGTSPPFGLNLFVMKAVAPKGTGMRDIYMSALPFIGSDIVVIAILVAFPTVVTFLPAAMLG